MLEFFKKTIMAASPFFESKKEYGVLLLRLLIGIRLVEGMWNIIFDGQIQGVAGFFDQFHIPFPTLSAMLCVYAEFLCGILFLAGLWVRMAALLMIFTFTIAILVVDIHNGFEKAFPAWTIWAVSIFLLFYGAGTYSIDEILRNRREAKMT